MESLSTAEMRRRCVTRMRARVEMQGGMRGEMREEMRDEMRDAETARCERRPDAWPVLSTRDGPSNPLAVPTPPSVVVELVAIAPIRAKAALGCFSGLCVLLA